MHAASGSSGTASKPAIGGLAPGQSVGGERYLLKKILGQGGMGVVWLAHDKLLREPVALKLLPLDIAHDPAALAGLRRETLQARRLSHPHILRIHDLVDRPGEAPFISMEYMDGPNLEVLRLRRPSPVLPWKFLAPLVRQLCTALDYAHGEHVIHRDLKPANLMLDSSGRLKLADFGLAQVSTDSLSRRSGAQAASGTLPYMSPQQADGGRPQVTDDLYALGATLYELLTSTPPFHSGDVAYQVRNIAPPPLDQRLLDLELTNDIPPAVGALVLACLAKEPSRRPQSARDVLQWLDAVEAGGAPSSGAAASIDGISPTTPSVDSPSSARPPTSSTDAPPVLASDLTAADAPGGAVPAPTAAPDSEPPPAIEAIGPGSSHPSKETAAARGRRGFLLAGAALLLIAAGTAVGWHWARSRHSAKTVSVPPTDVRSRGLVNTAGPTSPQTPAVNGFENLFNGHDLSGWDGDPQFWFIKDMAITAITGEETIPRRQNTCLIWRGTVDDFELRLRFRLSDMIVDKGAQSGVLYRGRRLDGWQVRGYQADLQGDATGCLVFIRQTGPDMKLEPGYSATLVTLNGQTVIQTNAFVGDRNQIRTRFRKNDWNELTLIARGNHLVHLVNGMLTAEVIDQTAAPARAGLLALELKRATTVQFKDIRLKRLPPAAP